MSTSFTSFNKGFGLENSHTFECLKLNDCITWQLNQKLWFKSRWLPSGLGLLGPLSIHPYSGGFVFWLRKVLWVASGWVLALLKIKVDWLIDWQLSGRLVNHFYFNVTRILCRYRCVANIPVNHTETHPVGGHSKPSISWTNVLHACRMEQGQWSN